MIRWSFTSGMVSAMRSVSSWLVVGENACAVSSRKAQMWVTRCDGPRAPEHFAGFEIELPDECDSLEVWQADDGLHVLADGIESVYMARPRFVERRHKPLNAAWLAAFAAESIQPERAEHVLERSRLRFEFRG